MAKGFAFKLSTPRIKITPCMIECNQARQPRQYGIHRNNMKRSAIFSLILIVAAAAAAVYYLVGISAPAITLAPSSGAIAATKELKLALHVPRAHLTKLSVTVRQGDKKVPLLDRSYPPATQRSAETFTLGPAGLSDGPVTVTVTADASAKRLGLGKTAHKEFTFTLENKPPVVAVLTTAHNITKGGAALVVYTVSKEVAKTGVVFGSSFFPGYRQGGNKYACLFPFPYAMDPNQYIPKVLAVDSAGNERLVTINYHLLPKKYPTDRINLSDALLDKVAGEFKNKFPQGTPLEIFLRANRELREQDTRTMIEVGRNTSPTPLWKGSFIRMPNSATVGSFAQTRTYVYQGKQVDQQTHLGTDLASTIHAPVPAANDGRVVFANDLGLYGQCVIIDHGLGLQTLYGHLSQITTKAGDTVAKGQTIGNTGSTGMAAGDHLHFGVNVSGEAVNPLEWWDPSWLKNNVTSKLEGIVKAPAPVPEAGK